MSLPYRTEIDGLRAIAVLAVILHHAGFTFAGTDPFAGGYIGVDVFFVISGYLITSIILPGLKDGTFSFLYFFERRARRILPVLLTVMIASLPLAWALFLPKAMQEFAASVLASLAFVSNYWFWKEDSYWAEPGELKPFLHTWSLSVEIQFYVLFPVLLLVVWKFARERFKWVLLLLAAYSLYLADNLATIDPEMNFYLLGSRMWEFVAGAVLAGMKPDAAWRSSPVLGKAATTLGLALFFFSVAFFDEGTPHPSITTLLPVAGTMLLIAFAGGDGAATRLLKNRWVAGVGLISYSLYLWHYPVFAFFKILDGTPLPYEKACWVAVTFLVSIAGYFVIERPFRRKREVSTPSLAAVVVASGLVIAAFNAAALESGGRLGRFDDWQLKFLGEDEQKKESFTQYVISRYNGEAEGKDFTDDGNKKLLLIGDSYSQDFYNILAEAGYLKGVEAVASYLPTQCLNSPSSVKDQREARIPANEKNRCTAYTRVGDPPLTEKIAASGGVIVITAWDAFTGRHAKALRDEIISLGARNVLIVGRKNFPELTARELKRLNREEVVRLRKLIDSYFYAVNQKMQRDMPDGFLDLHRLVCGADAACPAATSDGFLISYDGGHLTQEGARFIGRKLGQSPAFNRFWETLMHG